MGIIERKTIDAGRWSDVQSVDNAVAMFEVGKEAIVLPAKSGKGYTRRGATLAWTTVFKHLSEHSRNKKNTKAGRGKRSRAEESQSSESDEEEVQVERDDEDLNSSGGLLEAIARQPPPPKKRHSGKK